MNRYIAPDDLLVKLESANPEDRQDGLLWIVRHKYTNFLGDVLQLLQQDPDVEVRARAAWTLDLFQNPTAIPALLDALYDPHFSVRSSAGWALVHFGNLAVPDVVDVLRDSHAEAREMAFMILKRIQSEEAREAIRRYWD